MAAADGAGLARRLDALRRSLPPGQAAVPSAENLSNLGRHRVFGQVAEAGPTRAILYVRPQDELLTSTWQQWCCKIEPDMRAWIVAPLHLIGLWERPIGDWDGVLGRGQVQVRLFERRSLVAGDVEADLAEARGRWTRAKRSAGAGCPASEASGGPLVSRRCA